MRAAVFESKNNLVFKDVDKPTPGYKEVLIQVKACGVCATDVHTLRGESISGGDPYPLIPGHECSGVVAAIGEGVLEVNPGDKVIVDPIYPCGQCHFCQNKNFHFCQNMESLGTTVAGAFAEYVTVPAESVTRFSKASFAAAALAEPLATVVYGQKRARIGSGDTVLIIGAGAIGLLHLQLAKLSGASQVVVVDMSSDKLAKAKQLGADVVVNSAVKPNTPDDVANGVDSLAPDEIRKLQPLGFDVVIEATGVPVVVEAAIRYLKRMGRLLIFGVSPHHSEVKINPYDVYRYDFEIIGAFALNRTAAKAIQLIEDGKIDAEAVIDKQFSLEQLGEALDLLAAGKADGKLQVIFE